MLIYIKAKAAVIYISCSATVASLSDNLKKWKTKEKYIYANPFYCFILLYKDTLTSRDDKTILSLFAPFRKIALQCNLSDSIT